MDWLDPRANPRNPRTKDVVTEFGIMIMTGNWTRKSERPLTGSIVVQMESVLLGSIASVQGRTSARLGMLLEPKRVHARATSAQRSHQCKVWHTR